MTRPVVAAYISGHGYGHWTRSAAVLAPLARDCDVHLRTSDRALALAHRDGRWARSLTAIDVGPGVAQAGPLAIDPKWTSAALARHVESAPEWITSEAAWLRQIGAALVFADIPPLAFAAARRAGVPSIGMGNFSWSWIYDGYADEDPWFRVAAAQLREAEARATGLIDLAVVDGDETIAGGGTEHFPGRVAVPPVANRPTRTAGEARRVLGLSDDERPLVLVTFGGFGGEIDVGAAIARQTGLRLLVVSAPAREREHVRRVEPTDAMPHQDLVVAVDAVIGKPGYGTVAECLARPTALVHLPRGKFREQAPLVRAIERWLPSTAMSMDELERGDWRDAIARARSHRPASHAPVGDGARAALDVLRARLGLAPSETRA